MILRIRKLKTKYSCKFWYKDKQYQINTFHGVLYTDISTGPPKSGYRYHKYSIE